MLISHQRISADGLPAMHETVPPSFSEADYLAANPDVAEAVAGGRIEFEHVHYERFGVFEN